MIEHRSAILDSPPIVRIDITDMSWRSLGLLGRLHGWIEGTPLVGKIWLRFAIGVVALGAGASLLCAAGEFLIPETTADLETVVKSTWLLPVYAGAFAAAFLSFFAFVMIHTYCQFFNGTSACGGIAS